MSSFTTQQDVIMRRAIATYGSFHQMMKVIEELGELERAVIKTLMYDENYLNNKSSKSSKLNLIEEIADVEIMIHQLKIMSGVSEEVEAIKIEKLQRLKTRIGD